MQWHPISTPSSSFTINLCGVLLLLFFVCFDLATPPPSGSGEGDLISSSRCRFSALMPIPAFALPWAGLGFKVSTEVLRPTCHWVPGKALLAVRHKSGDDFFFIFSGSSPVWAWCVELQQDSPYHSQDEASVQKRENTRDFRRGCIKQYIPLRLS